MAEEKKKSTTYKVLKKAADIGEHFANNPSHILGAQAATIGTMYAGYKFDTRKRPPKKLSNNPKLRNKVKARYDNRMSFMKAKADQLSRSSVNAGYNRNYERVYPERGNQFNKSFKTGKPVVNNPNKPNPKISSNTGSNYAKSAQIVNKGNQKFAEFGRKYNRLAGAFEKDKIKASLKPNKVVKFLGNLKKLSPFGLVGAIMTPKEAGAGSTLTQTGEYVPRKKVKTY